MTIRTPGIPFLTLALASVVAAGAFGLPSSGSASTAKTTAPAHGPHPNMICQNCGGDPDPEPTPTPTPRPTPTPPPPPPSFQTLMSGYANYDLDGDGKAEINSLTSVFTNPWTYTPAPNGVVIVLVSPSLLTDDPNIRMPRYQMALWLAGLGTDMMADGFYPYFVEADVYHGSAHQDGRTLLAMRRFLRTVKNYYPLTGVLMVGSFPDASIVRSVLVKGNATPDAPASFTSGAEPVTGYTGQFLQLGNELITTRADIVLGDLDGNWESLYRPSLTATSYDALPFEPSDQYPESGQYIYTSRFSARTDTWNDVFYIQDHFVTPNQLGNGWLILSIASVDEPSPEATATDQQLANRIARPEILVSRIDPLRVAITPTAPPDLDGKRSPIGPDGRPQELRYDNPNVSVNWFRDRSLERDLVADYIWRAHNFRQGSDRGLPYRTSAVNGAPGLRTAATLNGIMRAAASFPSFEPSTGIDNAMLIDYVNWLKEPAVLKGIAAHSDGINSQFGLTPLSYYIAAATGGYDESGAHVWRWVLTRRGPDWILTPSFEGLTVDANFYIYRTMWQTGVLASSGQHFYVHDGCEVMRPKNAESVPYNDPSYGQFDYLGHVANGESLMFYANGLGLMARNKVFNDTPSGFYQAINFSGGRFGYGWRAYFGYDAIASGLNERDLDPTDLNRRERTLQRKRSYFWSMIGDPTLKIRY